MKRVVSMLALPITLLACAPANSEGGEDWKEMLAAAVDEEWAAPEYRAFDFWIGEWEMNWRPRSAGRFEHDAEGRWTRQRVFPILGGKALVELAWARDNPEDASQRGFSIRYYDPARERWVMAQNWPNAADAGEAFLDQLVGREHLGRLTMYSAVERPLPDGTTADEHRRYNFADVRPGVSFRWDGSNTPDLGESWRTWYVVDAYRRRDLDPFGPAGTSWPGVNGKNLCTEEPHGAFDLLEGSWTGSVTLADGSTRDARLAGGKVLDGCGVALVLEDPEGKVFYALGYSDRFAHWVIYRLDDRVHSPHSYYVAQTSGAGAVFHEAPNLAIADAFTPYLSNEAFTADGSVRRMVIDTLDGDQFVVRTETRAGPASEWTPQTVYSFRRSR